MGGEKSGGLDPRRESFMRDWEANVKPLEEAKANADKGAIDYSLAGIKAGFLLNGGALAALPPLVAAFGLSPEQSKPLLFTACTYFAGGLVTAGLTTLLSYFTMYFESWCIFYAREKMAQTLNLRYYPPIADQISEKESEINRDEKRRKMHLCIRNTFQIFAILSGLIMFGLFVAGAWAMLGFNWR